MIVVFLLVPDQEFATNRPTKMNQAEIARWLNGMFDYSFSKKISNQCRQFIESCLMFEPSHRLKASQAKHHPWLQQLDSGRLNSRTRGSVAWKPTRTIAPPIQELPDIVNFDSGAYSRAHGISPYFSTSRRNLGKRDLRSVVTDEDDPQPSSYFTEHKRLKISLVRSSTPSDKSISNV